MSIHDFTKITVLFFKIFPYFSQTKLCPQLLPEAVRCSTDYFALLPWLFLFWAGYFLYGVVGRQRMEPLHRSVCPPLGWLGRHSLLLYLLHQPVIYGVLLVAFRVLGS